ncbi:flagellar basal-body MS-ring/collar protein FliF [Oceanobacillus bengalensis]|uniref:Flagellar M-ring protein n=1 Tax=Oceanobacillus bengalensis TaxID=1435466 RepID=A0A494Z4D2_9BACI|nr:flagellar basal-body MS-ring/collar protein FliF [Oceanobacillus bengalensis]RKQ17375.1 flagellar basal body M-ring protein FliF [Oceanobacillus bengalensis]
MNENLTKWKNSIVSFWTKRTKSQKGIFIGSILLVLLIIVGTVLLTTKTNFVTLYSNLSLQEVNQIKTELDARGIPYELQNGGTTISVPGEQVDALLVDLAGQGIPNSGNIDYSFFSENSSWGVTDNEFDVMKLDAMQTELATLMKGIEGINDAQVMINMPETPIFASETTQEASASIVLNTKPGYQFQGNQIGALYHLVSKAVPNLPEDNIVIMNQNFEYFDQNATQYGTQDVHSYQQSVKKDVEKDLQQRIQQMLGTMLGAGNVIVSVTADVDFTQENRTEELVEPVDIENMEGLPVSIQSIQESYTGDNAAAGVAGAGEEDVTNYPGTEDGSNGDYELDNETINYEFNRIRKEIVESPYKIRDLGIQVVVDNAQDTTDSEVVYLTQQEQTNVEEGISSILSSIIDTSIDGAYGEVVPDEKLSIVFQEFNGEPTIAETTTPVIPTWMYIAGAGLLVIIIILIYLLVRNRKQKEEVIEQTAITQEPSNEIPEMEQNQDSESIIRKKQLEKIAKEKPEDFAKLLRSWIGED